MRRLGCIRIVKNRFWGMVTDLVLIATVGTLLVVWVAWCTNDVMHTVKLYGMSEWNDGTSMARWQTIFISRLDLIISFYLHLHCPRPRKKTKKHDHGYSVPACRASFLPDVSDARPKH